MGGKWRFRGLDKVAERIGKEEMFGENFPLWEDSENKKQIPRR
ncbi:hypothetical protein SBA7_550010 [Candidatus Sulfotelmatobacter sp. SbA7]|nr:hypothetical protein SBA7_550010 [Candidatus Sulfotelmatobacter sp. SbA7]